MVDFGACGVFTIFDVAGTLEKALTAFALQLSSIGSRYLTFCLCAYVSFQSRLQVLISVEMRMFSTQ